MKQFAMKALAGVLVAVAPLAAMAESQIATTGSASAKLDFTITIPKFVYLRVGTGTPVANNTTVDVITFAPSAAQAATPATSVAGNGGDLTGGVVTAMLVGNNGDLTLTATPGAANLVNGPGAGADTIPFSEIGVASAANTTATVLATPALATTATTTNITATNKVVRQDAKWTYSYKNTNTVAPGTYTGRVTYSVAVP